MKYINFSENKNNKSIALLINNSAFNKENILQEYINTKYLSKNKNNIIALNLLKDKPKGVTKKYAINYITALLVNIKLLNIKTLFVCDADYFKVLTKKTKTEEYIGQILPCSIKEFENINVILGINYKALVYNPNLIKNFNMCLDTLSRFLNHTLINTNKDIIYSYEYPDELSAIKKHLNKLLNYSNLTVDIETYSLHFMKANIATIAFAWDEHNGIAFAVDFKSTLHKSNQIKKLLKKFFISYKGKLIYHNCTFDIKILIFNLWMNNCNTNYENLIEGLNTLTKNIHDTKLIAYLSLNSSIRPDLGLKSLSKEYSGKYALEDITNLSSVTQDELLKYNLIDCLSTWFVFKKYYPQLKIDNQLDIYNNIFIPSCKTIIQMELTGMPMNINTVHSVNILLQNKYDKILDKLKKNSLIVNYVKKLRNILCRDRNLKLKKKIVTIDEFNSVEFNPGSDKQVKELLYDYLKLPVLDKTKKGNYSVKAASIKKLIHQTTNSLKIDILNNLIDYNELTVILSTFMPAFVDKTYKGIDKNSYCLYGNFNLGGTVSGRLSSSKINLQNLPNTGTIYGKQIKECFEPPKGYVIVGADFSSLEDRISALTTKDPNKLKVYLQKYDGHCLRAYSYFKDQMPDIKQAKNTDKCFSVMIDGKTTLLKEGDYVCCPDGQLTTIEYYIKNAKNYKKFS